MASELENHALLQNWRIIAYGVVLSSCLLAAAVFGWANTPSRSPVERCSTACAGKMRSFTAEVPGHWSPVNVEQEVMGISVTHVKQVWTEVVPERCECQ